MSNINKAFANGKALIAFITCGDPDIETTAALVRKAAESGADMIELGIPFSDPTAEVPIVQEAAIRALKAGTTTDKIFDMVRELRRDMTVPITFRTYPNVVFSYGTERFISTCAELSVDGIMMPDVPYEEKDDFLPCCRKYGVELISVAAHTSAQRIPMIASEADGYLYISTDGKADIAPIAIEAKKHTHVPCVAELEKPSEAVLRSVLDKVDGVIITTGITELTAEHGKASVPFVGEYIRSLKASMK